MAQRIFMAGVHGLLGGPGAMGYSLGIDTMFRKARALAPERIDFQTFEEYEDPRLYAAILAAARRGDFIVGAGHSLGVPDIVRAAHRLGDEQGIATRFVLAFDGTWNAPSPAIRNPIRRIVNYYGTGFSALGHDRLAATPG